MLHAPCAPKVTPLTTTCACPTRSVLIVLGVGVTILEAASHAPVLGAFMPRVLQVCVHVHVFMLSVCVCVCVCVCVHVHVCAHFATL